MKCEVARNLMSAYIDSEINEADKVSFEKHLENCPHCREEYELLLEIVTDCSNIDEVELPESFREELHQKLINEKASIANGFMQFLRKSRVRAISGVAAAVLVVALVVGSSQLFNGNPSTANSMGRDGNADKNAVMAQSKPERGVEVSFSESLDTTAAQPVNKGVTNYSLAVGGTSEKSKANTAFTTGDMAAPPTQPMSRSANFDRKVIKNGNVSVKLIKLDEKLAQIRKLTEANGGYVESSQIENMAIANNQNQPAVNGTAGTATKYANIVIRVPAENFDNVFDNIKAMGKTLNENITGTDVTSQYRETDIKLQNLQVQEARLRELMAKANNVDEILKIENELNRIRTDIDALSGTLKQWDDQVAMSTISISLTEVRPEELKRVDVPSVWGKAFNGFIGAINNILIGLEKLVIFLISAIPYIIILAVLAFVVLILVKKKRKPNK